MKRETKHDLYLYLGRDSIEAKPEEGRLYEDDATAWIDLQIVRSADDGTVRNLTGSVHEDLHLHGWVRRDRNGAVRVSSLEIVFRNVYCANLRRVEEMVKFLRVANRRLATLNEAEGFSASAGQIANRVARALGLRGIVRPLTDRGWSYAENEFEFHGLGSVQGVVDGRIEEMLRGVPRVPYTPEEAAEHDAKEKSAL